MSKVFSALFVSTFVFASGAFASGMTAETSAPAPTAAEIFNGTAPKAYDLQCRTGYKVAPKYCWERGEGWVQCGYQCVYDSFTGGT